MNWFHFRTSAALACTLLLMAQKVTLGIIGLCPISQTVSEEMSGADVVAFVTLREPAPDPGPEIPGVEPVVPLAKFAVEVVLHGDGLAKPTQLIDVFYSGDGKPGDRFLALAHNEPPLAWCISVPITVRTEAYLGQILTLPESGKSRARFFHSFLQDADELLARDSYDELNKASFAELLEIKEEFQHDRIVAWIKDKDTPASRRRLYLRMLGICGNRDDVPLLEGVLDSTDRNERRGLDAAIACYLSLRGPDGLKKIQNQFLRNKGASYADTYSAIMAIRAQEGNSLPQHRRVESLRLMLDRPDLADLVIPDLARLKDWHQVERLTEMFMTSVTTDPEEKKTWVRIPVINYLRACPLPEARKALEECERLDPESMQRAKKLQPDLAPQRKNVT